MKRTKDSVYGYANSKPLQIEGYFDAELKHGKHFYFSRIYVISGANVSLLSCQSSKKLKIVKIMINTLEKENQKKIEKLFKKFPNQFSGIGKARNIKVKLTINKDVKPVAAKCRKQPYHTREKTKKEIQKLLDADIIEPATGGSEWVSPIVTPPKPGNPEEIRLCVDMRAANKAITRERHPIPTIEDLLYKVNGAKVFSKLDLNKGYHQLELDEESRYITTFVTHAGLFQYKRLSFGINSAAEIFQHQI